LFSYTLKSHFPLQVANISAWNYPYFTSANVFAAALVTGNGVLYKPSEHTTLTGLAIAKLLHEVRFWECAFLGIAPRSTAILVSCIGVLYKSSEPTTVDGLLQKVRFCYMAFRSAGL
jgi:hypothetical protein